jgi:hypothetical protein
MTWIHPAVLEGRGPCTGLGTRSPGHTVLSGAEQCGQSQGHGRADSKQQVVDCIPAISTLIGGGEVTILAAGQLYLGGVLAI